MYCMPLYTVYDSPIYMVHSTEVIQIAVHNQINYFKNTGKELMSLLSHTPDRCSEMYCFTASAIVVWHPWSK